MERTLDAYFDDLVIGADLSALSYAYNNRVPIIYTRLQRPFRYQFKLMDDEIDRYNKFLYDLSYNSLVPFSNLIQNIRIIDKNLLKATTASNIVINIHFKNLKISDDYKLEGLPPPVSKITDKNIVIDKYNMLYTKDLHIKTLKLDGEIMNTLHFIREIDTGTPYTCISVSTINDEELNKFENSQSYIRLNISKVLDQNNFKGLWDQRNNRFKTIHLVSIYREIFPSKNIYSDLFENHEFLYEEQKNIKEKKLYYVV